jgi:coenzyme F420-0:L-glutamate ligase/coenzyme F420-1:gamma-L-glutamate ligase
MASFTVTPVPGMPLVVAGDNLAEQICTALAAQNITLGNGDIVCVAQKVVSKAEGRLIPLASVTPSKAAQALASETDKDPRLVQLILDESSDILRKRPGVLIVRHRLGMVGANAGIDQSNIEHDGGDAALLLPVDPDESARLLQQHLQATFGVGLGVVITDSHNRPWRLGTIGAAIGCAGLEVLEDHRGGEDMYGRELKVTLINRADAIAGAATLVMGETIEKIPLAVVSGLPLADPDFAATQSAAMINRPLAEDLFT